MLFLPFLVQPDKIAMGKESRKSRTDRPSGRQAMRQPEHEQRESEPAVSALHQGQGPDFKTQDSTIQKRNKAVRDLHYEVEPVQGNKPHQQPFNSDQSDPRMPPEGVDLKEDHGNE
jgi:hypothetical protein